MKVICDKAGRIEACKRCPHNVVHDDKWPSETGLSGPQTCRAVMACEFDEEVVRCVPVKGENMKTGSVADDRPVGDVIPDEADLADSGDVDSAGAELEEDMSEGREKPTREEVSRELTSVETMMMDAEEAKRLRRSESGEKAPRKRRTSSNFALQKKHIAGDIAADTAQGRFWTQVQDGFVSPEEAIDYISKSKPPLTGTFRAIRVASAEYVSEMTTPEPVLTITKVKKARA